jgi:hypothetical protein
MQDINYLQQLLDIKPILQYQTLYLNLDDLQIIFYENNKFITCILADNYLFIEDDTYNFTKNNHINLIGNNEYCFINKINNHCISYIEDNIQNVLKYNNQEIFKKKKTVKEFTFLQQIIYKDFFIIDQEKHQLYIVFNNNKLIMRSESKDKNFKVYINYDFNTNINNFYLLEIHKKVHIGRFVILIYNNIIAIALVYNNLVKYCSGIYYNNLKCYFEKYPEFDNLVNLLNNLSLNYIDYSYKFNDENI